MMATQSLAIVREIQVLLMNKGFDLTIDGVLGPRTRTAVRAFQARSGITATGQCDEETLAALHE